MPRKSGSGCSASSLAGAFMALAAPTGSLAALDARIDSERPAPLAIEMEAK